MASSNFLRAFLASVLGTGLSRVLGAARDIFIASFLGAGAASDAFWIAFTVPNTFRRFVADEGLTGALIPAVAKAEEEAPDEAPVLANSVLTALLIANAVLCALGALFAEPLVLLFAWAWRDDPAQLQLAAEMTRWMMPFLGFVSLVSFFEALLNHRGHFFVPKVAPGLVSAGIVGCGLAMADLGVWALVWGVLVGGVVHVAINVPVVWRRWGPLGLSFAFGSERFRAVLNELGKVVIIGIFAQINILVLRQLATMLESGAVTHYWNANRVVDLAQGVIAVAIGSALLPGISQAVAAADWDRFRAEWLRGVRLAAFLLLPVGVAILAFHLPITAMLFRHGRYDMAATTSTAGTLSMLVPFLWAVAGINIVKKVFFALDDRNTLLAVGAAGVLLTGGLGVALVAPLDIAGLALALSISTTVQLAVYVGLLYRRLGDRLGLGALVGPLARMTAASVPAGLVLAAAATRGDWGAGPSSATNWIVFGSASLASILAWSTTAWLLGVEELTTVTRRVAARFGR